MDHNSLTLRQSGSISQPSSTPAGQYDLSQVVTGIGSTLDNNVPMFHSNLTYNDLYRMASETALMTGRRDLMDPGVQSMEDVDFFLRNLHYPARDTSNVRILIGFGIRTQGRGLLESGTPRSHLAPTCTTFPDLMKATKADWDDAFRDLNVTLPLGPIKGKDLIIWCKRTYGDNQFDWIEARNLGDYTQWYTDYVVHGRSSILHVLLRYKGPIAE